MSAHGGCLCSSWSAKTVNTGRKPKGTLSLRPTALITVTSESTFLTFQYNRNPTSRITTPRPTATPQAQPPSQRQRREVGSRTVLCQEPSHVKVRLSLKLLYHSQTLRLGLTKAMFHTSYRFIKSGSWRFASSCACPRP
jgi:hypothetical protein